MCAFAFACACAWACQILASFANVLVLLAVVYAIGAAILLIWPHTLLKVGRGV